MGRLSKEVTIYNKEVKELIAKRAKLEEDGTQEEWFVKNAVRLSPLNLPSSISQTLIHPSIYLQTKMIAESEKMITDTQERLKAGIADLESIVVRAIVFHLLLLLLPITEFAFKKSAKENDQIKADAPELVKAEEMLVSVGASKA